MEEYVFKKYMQKAIKALGYDKDELFIKLVDYSFQPFYDKPFTSLDPLYSISILSEFESRIKEKMAENPQLNDPKYKAMIAELMRLLIVSNINDSTIDKGLKYHLANRFETTLEDLIYLKGKPDSRKILKDDIEFMQAKKEEYADNKKGRDLEAFWQWLDKELSVEKQFLLPEYFISKLEQILKSHNLISENNDLIIIFSIPPVNPSQKANWKGSQLALMFMFYYLAGSPEFNNQSLYNFIAERFLIKDVPITARKLNNTYFNLMDTYFRKDSPELPKNLLKIVEILRQAIEK